MLDEEKKQLYIETGHRIVDHQQQLGEIRTANTEVSLMIQT